MAKLAHSLHLSLSSGCPPSLPPFSCSHLFQGLGGGLAGLRDQFYNQGEQESRQVLFHLNESHEQGDKLAI
jgi:hypothetical protein